MASTAGFLRRKPGKEIMKRLAFATLMLMMAASSLGTAAFAQKEKVDVGKQEFQTHCAACHGIDAKGNGIDTYNLEVAPPDLTLLARNNAGVFPIGHIVEVIDGRAQIKSHGAREMPLWGKRYAASAAEIFANSPYEQEAYIRGRVLILVDYLRRIQQN
jgi:mono/diheme cytochrome c family protein